MNNNLELAWAMYFGNLMGMFTHPGYARAAPDTKPPDRDIVAYCAFKADLMLIEHKKRWPHDENT